MTTNGKLHGGEWYDIPLYYCKGPSWASKQQDARAAIPFYLSYGLAMLWKQGMTR